MRAGDVLGLALQAMRQRKVRAALTVVGVAIGCFVLITSLSVGQGVQEVILGQLRKQDQLRRIVVWPGGGKKGEVPPADLEVPGAMSEARRERLREAIRKRWQSPHRLAPPGLKADQVEALRRLAHVETVTPALRWPGTVQIKGGGPAVHGAIRTVPAAAPGVARRLVAGRSFRSEDERGILVSEYAAYRWGLKDEASVATAVGQTAVLRLQQPQPSLAVLLFLLNVGQPSLSDDERRVLMEVLTRLPAAVEKMNLPEKDRKVLLGLLGRSRPAGQRGQKEELPILGVFRDVARTEIGPFDEAPRPVDVLVPPGVARELYFRGAGLAEQGLPAVSVQVDDERNLRPVEEEIKSLGLETFSLADLLDQVQLNVLLVSIACSFVAAIALVVAAIGITNTMLMSVLERQHEIGVMKAVGARNAQVLALFLTEGALVGAAGAAAGLLGAWLVSFPGDRIARHLVATRTPMELDQSVFVFPLWLVVGIPLGVCALTTLAGLYPARRAASIDPIEALRQR